MRRFILSLVALIGLCSAAAVANYAMTQGSGTTFGSTVVGGIHYVQMFICDLTTPGQCASVSAGGAVKVDGTGGSFPVSGTVATTQSGIWTVQPGNTANSTPWLFNEAQINGVTPLMGNGVTGTGSQRVTIASDNTAFSTNAIQSGTWNINNISGTITLPTLAATSTKQSDGTQKSQIVDGSGNVIASTSNNLNVQCANCSGSGVSTADQATFTAGSSLFAGTGGFFQTTATSNPLTNGKQGMWQMTAFRAGMVNLRDSSGAEILPATAANQATEIASLATIASNTGGPVPQVTGPLNAGTAVATNALVVGGQYLSTQPTMTNTQQAGNLFSSRGELLVVPGTSGFPVSISGNQAVNVAQIAGTTTAVNTGVMTNGTQRMALATDSPGIITLGQTIMSASVPVTIASNQSAIAVTPATQDPHIGETGSNQIKVQVAQTVTASAYAAGNALGGLMTVANATRVSGSAGAPGTGGILTGLQLNSKANQSGVQIDVFLFDANPTGSTCTDKSAFVLATADFDKVVGMLTIPSSQANGAGWFSGGTGSVGIPTYFPVTYDLASSTSIYACAVVRAAITPAATTDISFKYNILRN